MLVGSLLLSAGVGQPLPGQQGPEVKALEITGKINVEQDG